MLLFFNVDNTSHCQSTLQMLKKLTVYKELNVLLNAVLVEAMAQISYDQISEVQKASTFLL